MRGLSENVSRENVFKDMQAKEGQERAEHQINSIAFKVLWSVLFLNVRDVRDFTYLKSLKKTIKSIHFSHGANIGNHYLI